MTTITLNQYENACKCIENIDQRIQELENARNAYQAVKVKFEANQTLEHIEAANR